jgi:flagellar biosynthesis/type III secretory pathway M-ring protein FliF/YscJ
MYNLQQQQAPAPAPDVSAAQLKQQIQEQVRQATADARNAAKDAAQAARDAQISVPPTPPGIPMIQMRGPFERDMPPRVKDVSIAFFVTLAIIIIGLPIVRAIARRVERGAPQPAQIPQQMQAQMEHLMQSVDAIAIEVERISEGQRFATKMLAEKKPDV